MSALPPVHPYPGIARIAGPRLLGGLWNWCLFGVLGVQCYVYSYYFPQDNRILKTLVYTVLFLETVQTVLSGADIYYWFVSGYGDLTHLSSPFASPFDVPLIESVVSLIVEFFFAHRIWVLSAKRSGWFCLPICLCSMLNAGAAFSGGIYAHVHSKFPSGGKLKQYATIWMVGNTAADILIASAMVYYFAKRPRARAGYFSDHAIVKIVKLTIETNLLTTSVGIVSLIMVVGFPNENWYTCPTAILGKLYSNTLLVSLNNRISIRNGMPNEVIASRTPTVFPPTTPRTADSSPGQTFVDIEQPPAVYHLKPSGQRWRE